MAENSAIAWTDHTANFWMGCEKISPGCAHCYAETLTTNKMGLRVWGAGSRRQEVQSIWTKLRKWDADARRTRRPALVFVMSLGDFMEDHQDAHLVRPKAYAAMRETTHLTFQFLTKRPENYARFLPDDWLDHPTWKRVWLGTTIENNAHVHRADVLRQVPVPSGVRWLSLEPLLGPLPDLILAGLQWAIVGGESGPGYRPMDHAWARDIRDRSVATGVAFFMKQSAAHRTEMGTYLIEADGSRWAWKQYPVTVDRERRPDTAPVLIAPASGRA